MNLKSRKLKFCIDNSEENIEFKVYGDASEEGLKIQTDYDKVYLTKSELEVLCDFLKGE